MGDDDMQSEIEELRAQVDELKAEREAREKEQAEVDSQPAGSESTEAAEASGRPESSDLASQFQELFETIDEELKAANPLTVLVVFALGVLVGRLLPR